MIQLRFTFILILIVLFQSLGFADHGLVDFNGFPEGSTARVRLIDDLVQRGDSAAITEATEFLSSTSGGEQEVWARLNLISVLMYFESFQQAESELRKVENSLLGRPAARARQYYLLNLAIIQHHRAHYLSADSIYRSMLQDVGVLNDRQLSGLVCMNQAQNLRYLGDYEASRIKWYQALDQYRLSPDSAALMNCLEGLAMLKLLEGEISKAEADIQRVGKFWKASGNERKIANSKVLQGLIECEKGNFGKCIELATASFETQSGLNNQKGKGRSMKLLAQAYAGLENWDQALQYYQRALSELTLGKDLRELPYIEYEIGRIYMLQQNWEAATMYIDRGLKRSRNHRQVRAEMEGLLRLSDLQERTGQLQESLNDLKLYNQLKDSIIAVEKSRALEELEVNYETQKKEQAIQILTQDKQISANRWLTLALVLFAVIVITLLVIDGQRRKIRQEQQLHQTREELTNSELINTKNELDYNRKKLAIYMESLIRKNDAVQDLEERIKGFNEGKNNNAPEARELFSELADSRILTDEDWIQFKELFDKAYSGFTERLLVRFPNLTDAEQRLILLTKLELSTKVMANILGVSPDSVKKGRYRLKRKIGLEGRKTLHNVVNELLF